MELIIDIIENAIIIIFLNRFVTMNCRFKLWKSAVFVIGISILVYIMNQHIYYEGLLIFGFVLLYLGFLSLYSDESITAKLLAAIIPFILILMINAAGNAFVNFYIVRKFPGLTADMLHPYLVLFTKVILAVSLLCLLKSKEKYKIQLSNTANLYILFIYVIILTIFTSLSHLIYLKNEDNSIYIILALCSLAFLTVVMLIVLMRIGKEHNEEERIQLENQLLYAQIGQAERLVEANQKINSERHDIKHVLKAIKAELLSQDQKEAIKIIDSRLDAMQNFDQITVTSNRVFDYFINDARDRAHKHGFEFVCNTVDRIMIAMPEDQLCIVLGNILDNAIENCSGSSPKITVSACPVNEYFKITVTNTLDEAEDSSTPSLATRKDPRNHGFGLKNVKEMIRINGGAIDFKIVDSVFVCAVLLK